jgi:hypothetical protein
MTFTVKVYFKNLPASEASTFSFNNKSEALELFSIIENNLNSTMVPVVVANDLNYGHKILIRLSEVRSVTLL